MDTWWKYDGLIVQCPEPSCESFINHINLWNCFDMSACSMQHAPQDGHDLLPHASGHAGCWITRIFICFWSGWGDNVVTNDVFCGRQDSQDWCILMLWKACWIMRCVLLEQLAGFKSYYVLFLRPSWPISWFQKAQPCRMHWFQLKAATTLGRFPASPGFPEASPVKEISRSNEYAVWQCKIASVFWKRVYQGFYNSELSLFWGNNQKNKNVWIDWHGLTIGNT